MSTKLVRGQSLEDDELKNCEIKLSALEAELVNGQLRLSTLQYQLNSFEGRYNQVVGVLYAELDEVKAQIAEAQSVLNPADQEAYDRAAAFRASAEESAEEANRVAEELPKPSFEPSDSLKTLFREAAKRIHPDLAKDENERLRRHQMMIRINSAYEAGDEAELQGILQDWKDSQSALDEGVTAKLARILRKIAQVENSIRQMNLDNEQLQTSDLGVLLAKCKDAAWHGRDILLEMAAYIVREISRERENLLRLKEETNV